MNTEQIILRTKNLEDLVIDKSYTLIYEAIDRLIGAYRKAFPTINDGGVYRMFRHLEFELFGGYPSYDTGGPGDSVYDKLPLIEARG